MLASRHTNTLDPKRRCVVPADFRLDLGSSCMLVKGFDRSLFLYPMEQWAQYTAEHIDSRPDEDEDAMDVKFLFYSNSQTCEIDKQGRINIPQDFVEHAGIEREMVNIGFKNRVQIWSKEMFDAKMEALAPRGKELFSSMSKYVPKP